MSIGRNVLAAILVAIALNALLWPVVWGVLYVLTGGETSPLFRMDSARAGTLRHVLSLLFLASCIALVWRELKRERELGDGQTSDEGACTTADPTGEAPSAPDPDP